MPFTCPVCENEEYTEDDGVFFCTECGTQSQDYIVQEASEPLFFDSSAHRHEIVQAKAEGSRLKTKPSLGRPWTLYEAYQIIILAQADALISLGASQVLKDVVYTLWANYLSKLGIAFCAKERIVPEIIHKYNIARARESCRGNLERPLNIKKQPFQVPKRKGLKRRRTSSTDEIKGEPIVVGAGDTENNETHVEEPDEILPTMFLEESCFIRSAAEHQSYRQKAHSAPEWMDIKKTVALCYIGLMLTNPNILPCDVVRWIYEGKIPYLSTSHLLHNDMVISLWDSNLFYVGTFNTTSLIKEVNKLCVYLELKDIHRPDHNAIAERYVKDLCLPDEFKFFVQRLKEKVPVSIQKKRCCYQRDELVTLGSIVMAMKVIFGLDDSSEELLSKCSQNLQHEITDNVKLFIWSEWKQFMEHKKHFEFDAYKKLTSALRSSKLIDAGELLQCHTNLYQSERRLTTKYSLNRRKGQALYFDRDFRSTLAKPLSIARTVLTSTTKDHQPLNSQDISRKSKEFRESTVCHLIDSTSFKEKTKHIDKDTRHRIKKMLLEISEVKPQLIQYPFLKKTSELTTSCRHSNYLWLLDFVSSVALCDKHSLDKMVNLLIEQFSSGGSIFGDLPSSENEMSD